ncbi:Rib/alpha-like domain-containing protein, partial [Limosilactobacillus ingluviei]|uniref:Rib/alpha-like domain-containing protein n=1 Tax=Limosilactobacillus ingluviei TaxID=148604 RepID=UPI002660112E
MLNKFEETKRKQRFGLRKLKVGVASVLLGFTIFGFNLASQELPSVHADVASGSDSSSEVSAVSANDTSENVDQTATSDPTNTPGGETGTTEETSSVTTGADTKATSKTNNTAATNATGTGTKTDTRDLTPTEVPDENKTITVEDPMDEDLIDHGGDDSWVSKNTTGFDSHVKKVNSIVQQIVSRRKDLYFFEGLVDYNEIHNHIIILLALDRNSALAGYSQNDVYGFIIHTGKIGETEIKENIESVLVTPGQTYKSYYKNTDNPVQITNYGENVGISLRDGKTDKEMTLVPGGDQIYGFVPAFDDGQNNTLNDSLGEWDDNHDALFGKGLYADWAYNNSLATWETPIPKLTSMTIRYVDQATGKEIAAPKTITGFTYQGFEVSGLETPTIEGYTIEKEPIQDGKFAGQITNYKVGETYPLYFSNNVVVQQTVLNQAGDVLARGYFNGLPIPGASKVLKHGSSETLEIIYDGTPHYYQNKIGTVQQNLTYLYKADQSTQQSEMRIHYIDITDAIEKYGSIVAFTPKDGKELTEELVTLTGTIDDEYQNPKRLVKGFATMQADDAAWQGTYSATDHDAYVYLSSRMVDRFAPQTQNLSVPTGTIMNDATAAGAITNQKELPSGTTFQWVESVDTKEQHTAENKDIKVTYSDGTSEIVTTMVEVTGRQYPALPEKQNVINPKALTPDEKAKLLKVLQGQFKENGSWDDYWTVGDAVADDGSVTITHWTKKMFDKPVEDTELTVPGAWLVQKKPMNEGFAPQPPANRILVDSTSNVQPNEQDEVKQAILNANPTWPQYVDDQGKAHDVTPEITIGKDGKATIHFKDGSESYLPGDKLVVTKQNAKNRVVIPQRLRVVDVNNLSDVEKALAYERVRQVNPMHNDEHPDSEVANYQIDPETGAIQIVYLDGTISKKLPLKDLVQNAINNPMPQILVQELGKLSEEERAAILVAVRAQNDFPVDPFEEDSTDPNQKSLVKLAFKEQLGKLYLAVTYDTLEFNSETGSTERKEQQTVLIPVEDLTYTLAQPAKKVSYQKTPGATDLPEAFKSQIQKNLQDANPNYSLEGATFAYDLAQGTVTVTLPTKTVTLPHTTDKVALAQGKHTFKLTDLATGYTVDIATETGMSRNGEVTSADQLVTVLDDQGQPVDLTGKVKWAKEPDLSGAAGTTAMGTIEVVLPGLDPIFGDVTVNITDGQTDAQTYAPKGGIVTVEPGTEIKKDQALTFDQVKTVVTNADELPSDGISYTWTEDVSTDKGGVSVSTHVTIHYKDRSSESFLVTLKTSKYSDGTKPEASETGLTVDPGTELKKDQVLNDDQVKAVLSNADQLDYVKNVTWNSDVDTSKGGQTLTPTVTVHYTDGTSSEAIPVTVKTSKYSDGTKPEASETGLTVDPGTELKKDQVLNDDQV